MNIKNSKKIKINQVEIGFTKKEITAYGGFSLLADFLKNIKIKEFIERLKLVEEKSPNRIGFYDKLMAYTLTFLAGGSRFIHILYLGSEEIIKELFGIKRWVKASTTLTRILGKMNSLRCAEWISEKGWEYISILIPFRKIKKDWISFDSAVVERYGKQEGVKVGYNPKKKGRGSLYPLLGFLNKSKYVINIWNRPGNVASWENIKGFFENCYNRVKDLIKVEGVIADSGFYTKEFIEEIEREGLIYIITARLYYPLQRKLYGIGGWKEVGEGISVNEFYFRHIGWEKERRYIAVRQNIKRRPKAMGKQLSLFKDDLELGDYRYSVWVTNSKEAPEEVWKRFRPRANDENTIKELKEGFALGGFSMKGFYSTEIAMQFRILFYNLFLIFKEVALNKKERRSRIQTIRYKYFTIPGILGRSGRIKVLRLYGKTRRAIAKIKHLFSKIEQYFFEGLHKCNAIG